MEWLPTLISSLILLANVIIAITTYKTIYRHRVIYGVKTEVLRMPKGTDDDINALNTTNIDKKLQSGNYTILGIVERNADKDLEMILGLIKRNVTEISSSI